MGEKDSAIPFSLESICLNVEQSHAHSITFIHSHSLPNAMSPFALQITINLFTLIPLLTRAAVCLASALSTSRLLLTSFFTFPPWQVRQTAGETAVRENTKKPESLIKVSTTLAELKLLGVQAWGNGLGRGLKRNYYLCSSEGSVYKALLSVL